MTEVAAIAGPPEMAALRAAAEIERGADRAARTAFAAAVGARLNAETADARAAVVAAERDAVVIWRGERVPYSALPERIAATPGRAERNALDAARQQAVEAVNPLREAWLAKRRDAARELGFEDLSALRDATSGTRNADLVAEIQAFLWESETVYFAALRRYLAQLDIEQGDATEADLAHVLRGAGFGAWFDRRDQPRLLARVAHDLGRPPPAAAGDNGRDGGHVAYRAALERLGDALAAQAGEAAPGADAAVRAGYGALFGQLLLEDAWLRDRLGVPEPEIPGLADYLGFAALVRMRRSVARHLAELRLHAGAEPPLARAYYSGTIGLLTGANAPESDYLVHVGQGLESIDVFRADAFAGQLGASLRALHGSEWWHSHEAGATLGRSSSRGATWTADDVVAHLGYNRVDWRPVLRQIRTQLIGEMSGYGGPNITTRAGTRKV